jgi:hypothetical protein
VSYCSTNKEKQMVFFLSPAEPLLGEVTVPAKCTGSQRAAVDAFWNCGHPAPHHRSFLKKNLLQYIHYTGGDSVTILIRLKLYISYVVQVNIHTKSSVIIHKFRCRTYE